MRKHRKGGSGKRKKLPIKEEVERIWRLRGTLQLIKYRDHVVYRNTTPQAVQLSERVTIGWVTEETPEYLQIYWDLPAWLQKNEYCDSTSGMKILRESILERVYLV